MMSFPSCSDSSGCDDNSGDSITRVGKLGNCRGSCRSLFWIKYAICKVHNDDTALNKYLSEQPNTILRQSKYSHDCSKKYEYHSCTCG
jgi:hypothetical protein